jgi:hypothetical protein
MAFSKGDSLILQNSLRSTIQPQQAAKRAHFEHMLTSAFIVTRVFIDAGWLCSAAQYTAVHPSLMTRVSMYSSAQTTNTQRAAMI